MEKMRPAHVFEIVTPKKFVLNGLWFGPKKPRKVIILVHGLAASAFNLRGIADSLVDSRTAVVTFNNRGFEKMTEVKRKQGKKSTWVPAGTAHEVFTECDDDIQGAISAVRKQGVKDIFLAGHSTGCQKAYYWASKNAGGRGVKGILLLAPLSDYAIAVEQDRNGELQKLVARAHKLVRSGKPHELMPQNRIVWFPCDAQRFLSLNTPESAEEIFSYGQPEKNPGTFASVKAPTLVLLADADEHSATPAGQIAEWFEWHFKAPYGIVIVPKVGHGFKGGEKVVAKAIRDFISVC